MSNYSAGVFSDVHRTLLDLYVRLEKSPQAIAQEDIKKTLSGLRNKLANSKDTRARACYTRYLRLIALSLQDTSLEKELSLGEAPAKVASQLSGPASVAAPAQYEAKRIMVSGIGRSGTTMIFQQLARLLQLEKLDTNYRYEPYLWNINSSATDGNEFGVAQVHQFGLQAHLETPLLFDGSAPLHDRFIDHLFGDPSDWKEGRTPDACLTKVIRGSGRLKCYLDRYPDLKIIACMRNPFDTLNSSLGMFSFFGEEFHADDRARFRGELEARGLSTDHLPEHAPRAIEWYGTWWQIFTEQTLAAARAYPDNFYLFCHEDFKRDSTRVFQEMQDFVGLHNPGIHMGLSRPAGPTIKATSLTASDVSYLSKHHAYYEREVLSPLMSSSEIEKMRPSLVRRYALGKFSFPVAGSELGQKAPIQLRGMMLNNAETPTTRLVNGDRTPLDLPALITEHAGDKAEAVRTPVADPETLKKGKTFGVVLTCHNNADTIVDAVQSCLNQTLPYDEIVVVDDASRRDDSRDKLKLLATIYSSLKLRFLESSLGPSGARHIGINTLSTDYWTQLDGDDLYWPGKNEAEARALDGRTDTVAFSDILLVLPNTSFVQSTATYDAAHKEAYLNLLARQPQIPRDMTMPRELYLRAGGYNFMSHLYEDWDFKMRLASLSGTRWKRADGVAGTVYNRLSPGLSGADPGSHARSLIQHFFNAIGHYNPERSKVLAAFDNTIKNFSDRHVAVVARRLLVAALSKDDFDPVALAKLVSTRQAHVMDNATLIDQFEAKTAALTGTPAPKPPAPKAEAKPAAPKPAPKPAPKAEAKPAAPKPAPKPEAKPKQKLAK